MTGLSRYAKLEFSWEEFEKDFLPSIFNADMSVLIYQDDKILYANGYFFREFGYQDTEMSRVDASLLKAPKERERFHKHLQFALEGRKFENDNYSLTKRDGQEINTRIQIGRFTIIEKGPHCCCWILNDTASHVLENEGEDENIFKLILDKSFNAILLADDKFQLVYANEALLSLFGFDNLEECKATPVTKVIAPESLPELAKRWKGWMGSSTLPPQFICKIIRKNGEIRDIEMAAHTILFNGVRYRLNSAIDITDKVRAEQALMQSEKRYRTLIETIPDIIAEVNRNNDFVWLNREGANFFGSSALNRSLLEFATEEEEKTNIARAFQRLFSGDEQNATFTTFIKNKNGEKRILFWICKSLYNDLNEITAILCTARDFTEQKEQEEQLNIFKQLEAVGRLAGGVAHDFNNMLSVILSYCTAILQDSHLDKQLSDDINEIKNAADKAASITRQLLAFSRKQMLQPKVINLNKIIEDIGNLLRPLIGENIDLRIVTDPGLKQIKADPGQIEQVIVNLAVNARDAMPHGGKLTIETSNITIDSDFIRNHIEARPGHYVRLNVTDTGSGIELETQSHVFEPFFTTKEKGKGTGLGLSTIYGIVKQSNGYIYLYSEQGIGTSFKIYLPVVDEDITNDAPKESLEKHFPSLKTVLLVEDEESLRKVVLRILKRQGFTVLEAKDGKDALLLSSNYKDHIHLMLTDIVMPGMSGRELAEKLTLLRPKMEVIYMSGYTDDAIIHHGVLDSGIPFLEKPFTPYSLIQKIKDVLENK